MRRPARAPLHPRPPAATLPQAGLRRQRRQQWSRRLITLLVCAVVAIAGTQVALAMRPPPPLLMALEAPAVNEPALRFSKRVPIEKHLRFTMPAPAPVTLDELTDLMLALQRTEHIRMAPKDTRHLAASILIGAERWSIDPLDMTALAWIESRFRPEAESRSGACGMFQQIPRYARPMPTTCARLHHPDLAAFHAGAFITRYRQRWGGNWACHYNGGMVCGPRAWAYAIRHAHVREQLGKALVRLRESPRWAQEFRSSSVAARESARSLLASNRQFLPEHQSD